MKLRNPLGFSSINNMLKDRLFKRSRLKFDSRLFRLEKFSELSGNKPQAPGMDCANLWINHSLADKFCVKINCVTQWIVLLTLLGTFLPSRDFPPFSLLSRNTEAPGAHFSKVPKIFGRISGDIVFFVSSKRRRLNPRNFAVILIFLPLTTYENTSFIG